MRHQRSGDLAEAAVAASGVPCVAIVTQTDRVDLRWARTTLTTNGSATSREVTIIAFDHRPDGVAVGSVSRSEPQDVQALVAEAIAASRSAPLADDADNLLAEGPDFDGWSDGAAGVGPSDDVSTHLGEVFGWARQQDIELFGYAEEAAATTWLASSSGLRYRGVTTQARLEITAKSHGRSRSTWWGAAADRLGGIDPRSAQDELARALDWQATSVQIDPGRHRVLLSPGAIGDLMVDMWWSMLARDAVEGRSVFSAADGRTRIGETLANLPVDLSSDPAEPLLRCDSALVVPASSAFASVFDNGAPLGRVDWLRGGRLESLIGTRAFTRSAGLPFTPAADNFTMAQPGAAGTLDDLVANVDHGLLITCLWYNRVVDPQTLLLTGLTRDGVYLVRDGQVVGSVGNFRFNDSPVALLNRLSAVGDTARTMPREMGDYAARVAMPPVVVEEFNLSTRSDAL